MITNMVVTGAKKSFSRINIISTHGGGAIPFLVNRVQTLEHTFGVGPGRLELSSEEVREGIASFYYDLTAATSEAQLDAILKLVPVSQLLMGLDFPLMPKSTFALAISDLRRYPVFSDADLQSISYANALRLFPRLARRIGKAHSASDPQFNRQFGATSGGEVIDFVKTHRWRRGGAA
jgi:predicted TIM-barrel fold metal-dependent hydrolase